MANSTKTRSFEKLTDRRCTRPRATARSTAFIMSNHREWCLPKVVVATKNPLPRRRNNPSTGHYCCPTTLTSKIKASLWNGFMIDGATTRSDGNALSHYHAFSQPFERKLSDLQAKCEVLIVKKVDIYWKSACLRIFLPDRCKLNLDSWISLFPSSLERVILGDKHYQPYHTLPLPLF